MASCFPQTRTVSPVSRALGHHLTPSNTLYFLFTKMHKRISEFQSRFALEGRRERFLDGLAWREFNHIYYKT